VLDVAGTRSLRPGDPHPFSGLDVGWLLDLRARTHGKHPYLVWQPFDRGATAYTFGQVAARSAAVAAGMQARGVQAGDRVLVHLDNSPELVVTWFACARLGAVAVLTNTRLTVSELAPLAARTGVVAGVTQPGLAATVAAAVPGLRWLAVTDHDAGEPPADGTGPDAASSWSALVGDATNWTGRAPDPLAPVSVQFTSGTSGDPKGVVWTHANALWGARTNAVHEDLRQHDVHLVQLPAFHTNGLAYSLLASLWAGCTAVLVPRFSASRFWDLSLRHRCTWAIQTRFTLRVLRELDTPGPGHHQYRLWGNAVADPPDDARHGVRTLGWWGMTETIGHGFVSDVHTPSVPLSMGQPAPEYAIRVVDGSGGPSAPGEPGHLLVGGVRGLSLFAEYLDDPVATADAFDADGWFHTGDRVAYDGAGGWFFVDRDRDVLRVAGENVASSEVEAVVVAVDGVAEAAVVGRPHEFRGEEPVVFVVLRDGADGPAVGDAVLARCAERLADFKVPRAVHVVDALPRATLEKVAKAELRRRLAAGEAPPPVAHQESP
jgi:carnitine-CoA ligase